MSPCAGPGAEGRPGGTEAPELARRLRLMIVTEPEPRSGLPLSEVVEAALAAGATAVELRHEGARGALLLEEASALLPIVRRHGALFLVNDRADVALAAGADGVHLGPDDPPVAAIRRVVPPHFLVGYSTDQADRARKAVAEGADYLGVGAVYGTRSKAGLESEAIGPERVGEVLRAGGRPGVGIGGITAENAEAVARTGAGVAVLGAVMGAAAPGPAAKALVDAVERGWSGGGARG